MGNPWSLIICWSLLVTLWVSPYLMTLHTQLHAQICGEFVTSSYSDYWTKWAIMRVRWEEGVRLLIWQNWDSPMRVTHWKKRRERNTKRRGVHRHPQIHGFDICVLLDSLLTTVCHTPPLLLTFTISPLVSCVKEKDYVGGGMGENRPLFSGCCARHAGTHLRMKGRLM